MTAPTWRQRHPDVVVALAVFVALVALLVVKNHGLFQHRLVEDSDAAANSIITQDAKHLRLLVGNYSRQGFSHPGPAAFYLQAGGEALFYDTLRVVPAAYNGQVVAILIWNAALLALVAFLVARAFRSPLAAVAAVAAVVGFASFRGNALSATWMPYYYVAPFLLLLVGLAALMADDAAALPLVTLAGGLLVHGHVEFVFFVPLLVVGPTVVLVRRSGGVRASLADHRRWWLAAGGLLAVFALPIGLNLALHWPGEFGKYLTYGRASHTGHHGLGQGVRYTLRLWSAGWLLGRVAAAALVVGAGALAALSPAGPARRFAVGALTLVGAATVLMVFYAVRGIDDLSFDYIGYFYWAAPALALLVVVAAATRAATAWPAGRVAVAAGAAVTMAAASLGPGLVHHPVSTDALIPHAVAALAARRDSARQPIAIRFDHDAWPDVVGFVVAADRRRVQACVADPAWTFMFTRRFVCPPTSIAGAQRVYVHLGHGSPPAPVLAIMKSSTVTADAG